MNRNGLIIGGVVVVVCACLALFMAWDIKTANEARSIAAYNNSNIPTVQAALARNPNDAGAHMSLGRDLYIHRNYQGAIAEFQQVSALEPATSIYNSEALFLMAAAQKRAGHPDQALLTYRHLASHQDGFGRKAAQYVAHQGG